MVLDRRERQRARRCRAACGNGWRWATRLAVGSAALERQAAGDAQNARWRINSHGVPAAQQPGKGARARAAACPGKAGAAHLGALDPGEDCLEEERAPVGEGRREGRALGWPARLARAPGQACTGLRAARAAGRRAARPRPPAHLHVGVVLSQHVGVQLLVHLQRLQPRVAEQGHHHGGRLGRRCQLRRQALPLLQHGRHLVQHLRRRGLRGRASERLAGAQLGAPGGPGQGGARGASACKRRCQRASNGQAEALWAAPSPWQPESPASAAGSGPAAAPPVPSAQGARLRRQGVG
jgi:hypothetical protein